jgi:O-antigen ligase
MSIAVPPALIVKTRDWRDSVPGLMLPFLTGALFFRNNFPGVEAGLLITFLFNFAVCGHSRIEGRATSTMVAVYLLMIAALLGNVVSSEQRVMPLMSLLLKFFIFFALVLTSYSRSQLVALLRGFIAGGVVSSFLMALNFFGFIDISPPSPFANYVEIRQSAFMGDPNVVGAFLVFAIVLSHHHFRSSEGGGSVGTSALLRRLVIAVLVVGLLLTFSRAAWINLFVSVSLYGMLVNMVLRRDAARLLLVSALAMALVAVVFAVRAATDWLDLFFDRFDSDLISEATFIRVDTQRQVLQAFFDSEVISQLFGHGAYSSELVTGMPPHFTPLQILYEAGIISFVLILVIGLLVTARAIKFVRREPTVLPVIPPCLVGLLVNSGAIDVFYWRLPWLMIALVVVFACGPRVRSSAAWAVGGAAGGLPDTGRAHGLR